MVNDLKSKIYTALLSPSFFEIGKRTTIIPPLRFGNLGDIKLGEGVTIHANCWIQALNGGSEERPKVIIHDHASIGMNATISAAVKIVISSNI